MRRARSTIPKQCRSERVDDGPSSRCRLKGQTLYFAASRNCSCFSVQNSLTSASTIGLLDDRPTELIKGDCRNPEFKLICPKNALLICRKKPSLSDYLSGRWHIRNRVATSPGRMTSRLFRRPASKLDLPTEMTFVLAGGRTRPVRHCDPRDYETDVLATRRSLPS